MISSNRPVSSPRSPRIFLQCHFGRVWWSIALSLLLTISWPIQAGAEDEKAAVGDKAEVDYSDVEEITITGSTGQMIETAANESAVQFDASELTALGATDISDIAKVTPNLEITQSGATTSTFFIRGVGLADFSANSASAVAIYMDGVPLNSSALQSVAIFDPAAVAVLRGPQGAGSGRNASAGAIKINSRKPTGEFQAQLKTTIGSFVSGDARNALIQDYEGAIELPLVEGLLSTRLSFRARVADPYMTNGCGGAPPFSLRPTFPSTPPAAPTRPNDVKYCGEQLPRPTPLNPRVTSSIEPGLPTAVGDQGNWATRGLFRLQPDALDMDWLLSLHGSRLDQQSTLGQAMGTGPSLGRQTVKGYFEPDQAEEFRSLFRGQGLPRQTALDILANNLAQARPLDLRPYRGDYNRVGQTTRDTWGASLSGELHFDDVGFLGPVTLETISAYDGYTRFRDTDQDFTPDVLFESIQDDEAWQFFQELKATGEGSDGLFRWEVGGYYLMEDLKSTINQKTVSAVFDFLRDFDQQTRSFAFYGGFGWDFLEDFTLDVGVRYNWEQKAFNFSELQGGGLRVTAPHQQSVWTAPTWKLGLTYRFTEEISGYWKYSRGWKGGHFNANRLGSPPANPETVDSIETGLSGSWLDARLSLSGTIFYYKYKDYQLFLFENAVASPPILEIVNANDAEQYGAEIEIELLPLEDWAWIPEFWSDLRVSTNFGWLQSQFLDFVNLVETIDPATQQPRQQEVVYTGKRLPNSPEFKVNGTVEWPLDFGRFGSIIPRYDIFWTDDIFYDPNEGRGSLNVLDKLLPPLSVGQPAYMMHNLRLTWRDADGNLEISGWVQNLTDTRYKTYAFDASIFAAVVINFVGEPRTAGVDVTFRF